MKETSISYLHQLISELLKVLFGTYLCKVRGLPFSPSVADVLLPTEVSGPGPVLIQTAKAVQTKKGGEHLQSNCCNPCGGWKGRTRDGLSQGSSPQHCVRCPPVSCFSCFTASVVSAAPGCQVAATSPASIPSLTGTSACCY